MVSFFGLKIGGGKAKANSKQQTKQLPRSASTFNVDGSAPSSHDQFYSSSNFSRKGFHVSRPGTASSNFDSQGLWRAPYMGPAAASSMVDLAPPRTPAMGNLRYNNSDANLGTRFRNGSVTSLVKPAPVIKSSTESTRLETPTRPTTSGKKDVKDPKDVENPFRMHFGKESVSSRPGTPLTDIGAKSSLDQFEFGLGRTSDESHDGEISINNNNNNTTGYPSPPPSINSTERPSSSRRNQPSALRNEAMGPRSLPSPAASVARSSEEVWETPVIRNVQAKRDTLTFHPPRRQSVSMEVEESAKEKPKLEDPPLSARAPMTEGFAGNFAGFDFGESVRRASVGFDKRSVETRSSSDISPTDTRKPAQNWERVESPLGGRRRSPTDEEKRMERARNTSDPIAPMLTPVTSATVRQQSPLIQQVPLDEPSPPPTETKIQIPASLTPGPPANLPPQTKPPTAPIPPPPVTAPRHGTAAPAAAAGARSTAQREVPSSSTIRLVAQSRDAPSPPNTRSSPQPREAPHPSSTRSQGQPWDAPRDAPNPSNTRSTPQSREAPNPSNTSKPSNTPNPSNPPKPSNTTKTPNSPNPSKPSNAPRPGYINRPLDPPPPPRGFRPRVDSNPEARRPNGLRVPPPLVDRTRSPYGPPPEEGNYMRSEPSPKPPMGDNRAPSPFTARGLDGDFPVSKGLPRGRPPPRVDSRQDGLSPRIPPRGRPLYPTQPTPSPSSPSKQLPRDAPSQDHGFTLPNWDDFDRADPHRSAIPAPLSPFRASSPFRNASPTSPSFTSSPISPTPPSLPSPSFSSLQQSISNSSEAFARSFDAPPPPKPLISPVASPVAGDFGGKRVEAKRAPPRPSPITLPPSKSMGDLNVRKPTVDEFSPGFI